MDVFEALHTRRSIRKYKDQPVKGDMIRKAIAAAMDAPSAGNEQAWHFVVIDDRELLDRVPEHHPYCAFIRQTPVAVLVCGDTAREKYAGFWVQDASAATQNFLLAVHAQGLGACWTGVHPDEDRVAGLRALLKLPEHLVPFALIPVGWPDQQAGRVDRFDEARVTRNVWTA